MSDDMTPEALPSVEHVVRLLNKTCVCDGDAAVANEIEDAYRRALDALAWERNATDESLKAAVMFGDRAEIMEIKRDALQDELTEALAHVETLRSMITLSDENRVKERADASRAVLNLSHDFKHLRAAAEAMVAGPGGRGPTLEQALRDIEQARRER